MLFFHPSTLGLARNFFWVAPRSKSHSRWFFVTTVFAVSLALPTAMHHREPPRMVPRLLLVFRGYSRPHHPPWKDDETTTLLVPASFGRYSTRSHLSRSIAREPAIVFGGRFWSWGWDSEAVTHVGQSEVERLFDELQSSDKWNS